VRPAAIGVLLFVAAVLVACSGPHLGIVGLPIGTRQQILLVGDSITARDEYQQKLIDHFSADGRTVTLLGTHGTAPRLHEGMGGDRIASVQARIGAANSALSAAGAAPNLIWLEIGVNDCLPGDWTSAAAKKEELRTLLQTLKAAWPAAKVVFANVWRNNVDPSSLYDENILAWDAVLPALASEEGVILTDMYALITDPSTQVEAGGVHMLTPGNQIIADGARVHPALVLAEGETLALAVFVGDERVLRTFGTGRYRVGRSGWLEIHEVI
jgi:lysophospholipase L1-like esterase